LELAQFHPGLWIDPFLIAAFRALVTGGVGGVFIVTYATRDLFTKEDGFKPTGPRFVNDYQELMWLAAREKHTASAEEVRRFYQLRRYWPEMHSYIPG